MLKAMQWRQVRWPINLEQCISVRLFESGVLDGKSEIVDECPCCAPPRPLLWGLEAAFCELESKLSQQIDPEHRVCQLTEVQLRQAPARILRRFNESRRQSPSDDLRRHRG